MKVKIPANLFFNKDGTYILVPLNNQKLPEGNTKGNFHSNDINVYKRKWTLQHIMDEHIPYYQGEFIYESSQKNIQ